MSFNTTDTCLDPAYAFDSFENLVECFASQNYHASDSPYWCNDWGLEPNTTFGHIVGECIEQYCLQPDSALGGCSGADTGTRVGPAYGFSASSCGGMNKALNQDFSGPGMMVAYLIQPIIVIYIWLIIRGFRVLPKCIRCMYRRRRERKSIISASMDEKLTAHVSIVKSFLVDFQEAQCFFVICIQAAILVALLGNSAILGANSLAQLEANYGEATMVSGASATSVTLGLWILRRSNLDSTYIHTWSMTSLILSGVTHFSIVLKKPKMSSFRWDGDTSRLDKCGYRPPPLIFCSTINSTGFGTESSVFFAACFAISGIIGLQKICSLLLSKPNLFATFVRFFRFIQSTMPSKAVSILRASWTFLAEGYLLFLTGYVVFEEAWNLYLLSLSNSNELNEPNELNDWSFGQIVGVTIWAPVIIKYLYWAIFGTESYSTTRLSEPFHIVQIQTEPDSSKEPDEEQHLYSNSPSNRETELQAIKRRTNTWS